MIHCIKGSLIELHEDKVYVENYGLVWEIQISKYTYLQFNKLQETHDIKIYTYLHANDKGIQLYGFYSLAERSFFLSLQRVSGIGPKASLKILSSTEPDILLAYIKQKDIKNLSALPSVGKKKAASILLALEGIYMPLQSTKESDAMELRDDFYDIKNALMQMGYEKNKIELAMHTLEDAEVDFNGLEEGVQLQKLIALLESNTL